MRTVPALLAILLVLLAPTTARAGDTATLEILGFSADGGIFAFEEYGRHDGSGFPYSNRFYLDVATDSFLPGTPIRVRIDEETVSVDEARAQARKKAQLIVADAVLAANRGFTAGVRAVTDLSADPHRIVVNPRPVFPPVDVALEFRINEYPVMPPESCGPSELIRGFQLLRIPTEEGATVVKLHEDRRVPESRGCPLGYSIGAVQTFFPETADPAFAVLIAVESMGFEGPNHRFIAVPGRIGG